MTASHDDAAPSDRRRRRIVASALVLLAAATSAACDTGDGKTLQEPRVAFTTTVAPVETLQSVPLATTTVSVGGVLPAPQDDATSVAPPVGFQLFAPWQDGASIDPRHTCDGEDLAPAVSWAAPPAGTAELAIALVDESATDGAGPLVHWVMVGVDPTDLSVFEGDVPPGAVQAVNSFGTEGYSGPCPPVGDDAHRYRLTLYALNQQSELADGTPASNLLGFIEDVAIGTASVVGTVRR